MGINGSGDWLTRFVEYTFPFGEAPEFVYWWTGIATVSAVLRRRTWLSRGTYVLYPNLNMMFIAPPGTIQKSTTLDQGTSLLRQVEGVYIGPETATWQALFDEFEHAKSSFMYAGEEVWDSSMACFVGEMGTFIDALDTAALNQLITFWDGKVGRKSTLTGRSFNLVNPLIGVVGCTTDDWFETSFDERAVKGGFMSRFLLIKANEKAKLISNPASVIEESGVNRPMLARHLVTDLQAMFKSCIGPFSMAPDAEEWIKDWYEKHNKVDVPKMPSVMQYGYAPRKQTMIYKAAMVLSVARNKWPLITIDLVQEAAGLVTALEKNMHVIMGKIGVHQNAVHGDKIIAMLRARPQRQSELIQKVWGFIPDEAMLGLLLKNMAAARLIRSANGVWHPVEHFDVTEPSAPQAPSTYPSAPATLQQ